jgi:pimeloyl-ACP methyl ester carboxylesterase
MKTSTSNLAQPMETNALVMQDTVSNTQPVSSMESVANEAIRPFTVNFPEKDLADLKLRISATKFPEKEPVNDLSQGIPLATARELARYWAEEYDWRNVETRLNSYPQFITEIDGLDIHFIHVRSKHENALPIIVTHGWPYSIIALLKIIEPLINPVAYGGKAEDAFHVVMPSLPGFGFSGKPVTTGWGPSRIAYAWATLMKRLGYGKFLAQGGDWGAIITDMLAAQSPNDLLGIHTNMANAVPAEIELAAYTGAPAPAGLSTDEKKAFNQLSLVYKNVNYAYYMASRPQTLVALTDSPVALATWMIDPLDLELFIRTFAGQAEGITRDDVLDNVTLYWLTNTGVSAARIYWENKLSFFAPKGVTVPVAVSAFPTEIYQVPRSWAEKAYLNLVYYNKPAKGGHFPAWEQPGFLVEDIRAGFLSLRKS